MAPTADCGRVTGQPEVIQGPEVDIGEATAIAHEGQLGTSPTDGNVFFPATCRKSCRKARARMSETLDLFALLRHAEWRDFSVWTARSCK
jgi:hypothetical protein